MPSWSKSTPKTYCWVSSALSILEYCCCHGKARGHSTGYGDSLEIPTGYLWFWDGDGHWTPIARQYWGLLWVWNSHEDSNIYGHGTESEMQFHGNPTILVTSELMKSTLSRLAYPVADLEGTAPIPPTFGDRLTQSFTVMLASAKFW